MTDMPKTPRELEIWTAMTPTQRVEVMQAVGMEKSVAKTFRKCMAYIKAREAVAA